jgi:hypothetical protein
MTDVKVDHYALLSTEDLVTPVGLFRIRREDAGYGSSRGMAWPGSTGPTRSAGTSMRASPAPIGSRPRRPNGSRDWCQPNRRWPRLPMA